MTTIERKDIRLVGLGVLVSTVIFMIYDISTAVIEKGTSEIGPRLLIGVLSIGAGFFILRYANKIMGQ